MVHKQHTGITNGIPYDSLEEFYFFQWCFELKAKGYITSIERSEPYGLSDAVVNNYIEELKTRSRPKTQILSQGHVYTPEAKIVWSEKAAPIVWVYGTPMKREKHHLFVAHKEGNTIYSVVEVKPMFDFKNMERLARLNIKWVMQRYQKWVNLIKNEDLFKATFTPVSYLHTPSGKRRKIKWRVRTIDNFLNTINERKHLQSKLESSHI